MTSITLNGLTKRFEDVEAVKDMNIEVQEGEFLVLVGPSGCGKSTLLRLIAGLETPSEGEIWMGDDLVNDVEPADRNVAMVFQNYALYPHMSARRNMTFGARAAREISDEELEQRVESAAELLGIADLLDRKPQELSGGEQQRVAMGRALLRDPNVFLLDEPLSNLDAKLRDDMRTELSRLHDELQTTTVYVTHDQTEAMTLGDRIAVLNQGELQQIDTPQEVYDFSATEFVAEFIGSPRMNLIPVTVSRSGDTYVASTDAARLELNEDPALSDLEHMSNLNMGIRPEDIYPADEGGDSNSFTGVVTNLEPQGDKLVVYADLGEEQIQFEAEPRRQFEEGEQVELRLDRDRIHIYDSETGDAVYHSEPGKSVREITA